MISLWFLTIFILVTFLIVFDSCTNHPVVLDKVFFGYSINLGHTGIIRLQSYLFFSSSINMTLFFIVQLLRDFLIYYVYFIFLHYGGSKYILSRRLFRSTGESQVIMSRVRPFLRSTISHEDDDPAFVKKLRRIQEPRPSVGSRWLNPLGFVFHTFSLSIDHSWVDLVLDSFYTQLIHKMVLTVGHLTYFQMFTDGIFRLR